MTVEFTPMQLVLNCAGRDASDPTVVELTLRGDLVFHNWDHENDLIAEEMGFGTSLCLFLYRKWDEMDWSDTDIPPDVTRLFTHRVFIVSRLRELGTEALIDADYPEERLWAPNRSHNRVYFMGLHPAEGSIVTSINTSQLQVLRVMHTTVQGYMDVVNTIANGLVRDALPGGKKLAVAAIEEYLGRGSIIVAAGRMERYEIIPWRGIARLDEESGDWIVEHWIERLRP